MKGKTRKLTKSEMISSRGGFRFHGDPNNGEPLPGGLQIPGVLIPGGTVIAGGSGAVLPGGLTIKGPKKKP